MQIERHQIKKKPSGEKASKTEIHLKRYLLKVFDVEHIGTQNFWKSKKTVHKMLGNAESAPRSENLIETDSVSLILYQPESSCLILSLIVYQ